MYVIYPDWLDSAAGDPADPAARMPTKMIRRTIAYLPRTITTGNRLLDHWFSPFPISRDGLGPNAAALLRLAGIRNWLQSLASSDGRLAAIQIDGASADAIKGELRTCGVTESVIFPDLDGLGAEMNSLWSSFTST